MNAKSLININRVKVRQSKNTFEFAVLDLSYNPEKLSKQRIVCSS